MNIIAFIFARGGSKRIPGKNLKLLNGKPLITYSFAVAKQVKCINRIIVSTDCEKTAKLATTHNIEVPFLRPSKFALDDSDEILAWKHALNYLLESEGTLPDLMVSLPPTSPLRIAEDIEQCIEAYKSNKYDGVVAITPPSRNPFYNMVNLFPDKSVRILLDSKNFEANEIANMNMFDLTTVCYVANPYYILECSSLFSGNLGGVIIPKERSLDIDTIHDFNLAEIILNKQTYE